MVTFSSQHVAEEPYSRTPHIYIKNFLPPNTTNTFHRVLKAALVNSKVDLNIVKEVEKVEDVYVMHFKDCPYKIKGLERQIEEIGPYIFNLLCEWEDLEQQRNQNMILLTLRNYVIK